MCSFMAQLKRNIVGHTEKFTYSRWLKHLSVVLENTKKNAIIIYDNVGRLVLFKKMLRIMQINEIILLYL
ncbi:unnamed protein product [Rhizophagus irregularis]|nr:unnamed protein product [Rhizophagus irregularis]CAB5366766.1 unnamed protein product [Rhizophagus irregularis]